MGGASETLMRKYRPLIGPQDVGGGAVHRL